MGDNEHSFDPHVDSNNIGSSFGDTTDDEDYTYSISPSTDGDTSDGDTGYDDDDSYSHIDSDDVDVDEDPSEVRIDSMTGDEIRPMEFTSIAEAYEFYHEYGRCKGFAIRKSTDKKKGPEGRIVTKLFVCSRQGFRDKKHISKIDRKREHRRMTRMNCKARFRVTYKPNKDKYVVTVFEETHNHDLTPPKYVHLHPGFRRISEADRAQIDGMQSHGIRTCHIMGYMVAQKGGYGSVGFTKKDLYNYFDKKMRNITKDGDVVASLNYFNAKSSTDPTMHVEYAADSSTGRLKSLFWADGYSRSDYFCFGDVLAFDTTYKKNRYNYPLVMFSGCNHHSQTTIFGAAIVSDETTETYKWLLKTFLACMENKHPRAVVTDGDAAMREAIKDVFPDASHRLCSWHLNRNANDKVKNPGFLDGFKKAMYSNFTEDEFEHFWAELIKDNGVEGHPWVMKTYDNRSLWATAYLRDKFFGRFRTTSQCEAINAIIKNYVRKRGCIFEFVHNYEEAVKHYRNNEVIADFKSKFSEPVLTTQLPVIERNAAKIYTAQIFKDVKQEIMKAGSLIVQNKKQIGTTKMYTLTKFCNSEYERKVVCDGDAFQCSCKLFDYRGLPCSHIFHVMKEEHVDHIPNTLVLSRWTKDAKANFLNTMDVNGAVDADMIQVARFGAYCSVFTAFCKDVSKKDGLYADIMDDLMKLRRKYGNVDDRNDPAVTTRSPAVTTRSPAVTTTSHSVTTRSPAVTTRSHDGTAFGDPNDPAGTQKSVAVGDPNDPAGTQKSVGVGDPIHVNGKGAPKKKKNQPKAIKSCTVCKSTNHNARTCPEKKRKASCNGASSVQSKGSEQPTGGGGDRDVQKKQKCSEEEKECGPSVSMTPHRAVASTNTQFPPVYGYQPMMPMYGYPPMHVPYQVYGMNVGGESCSGLLQKVLRSVDKEG